MRIHLLSDIHLDIEIPGYAFEPSVLDADVTILAGDIHTGARGLEWARRVFPGPVLYVPGNHEFYGGHIDSTLSTMRAASCERVRFLEGDEVVLGGVRFLGATAWTDFTSTGDRIAARAKALEQMNDFGRIRAGALVYPRWLHVDDVEAINQHTKAWLRARLAEPFAGPTCVITHHAPLPPPPKSRLRREGSAHHWLAAYVNDWEDLMGPAVALWVHGHTHEAMDRVCKGTRVVCNPVGYPFERTGYTADKILTLEV